MWRQKRSLDTAQAALGEGEQADCDAMSAMIYFALRETEMGGPSYQVRLGRV